jgi:hypothetical protein
MKGVGGYEEDDETMEICIRVAPGIAVYSGGV